MADTVHVELQKFGGTVTRQMPIRKGGNGPIASLLVSARSHIQQVNYKPSLSLVLKFCMFFWIRSLLM